MLWGQSCAACSALPGIFMLHPPHDTRLALRFHCWGDFCAFKGELSSTNSQATFWFRNQAVPLVLVFIVGVHMSTGSSHVSEFAWGKLTEHLGCVWYKKQNFFQSTQWVKLWANFTSGSLWKMLFYSTIKKGLPVFVLVLSSNSRDHNVNISNRHSKLRIVGGIMHQPNLGGGKHGLISANASNRKT